MRESDLRILESLLTSFSDLDEGLIGEVRIDNPQERLTETLESYLTNKLSKLISIGAEQSKMDECERLLKGIRKNV